MSRTRTVGWRDWEGQIERRCVCVCVCKCVSVTRGGAAHKHNSWQLTERAKHLKEQHTGQSHSRGRGCAQMRAGKGEGPGKRRHSLASRVEPNITHT